MENGQTMRIVAMNGSGGPEVLVGEDRPLPEPSEREVRVRIAAAGVNRPDVMQRMGHYPPPQGAPEWPGLEIAGIVDAVGQGVTRFAKGDRLMALVPGGGYAEAAVVHEDTAVSLPDKLDFVQAAAIPETFFTVWSNVFMRAGLKSGETFLVHGGTSGIGTTAIQLARHFGAKVFATAGSAAKCAEAEKLGADACFNYRERDFAEAVMEATGNRGADVILDMVGGDYTNRNLKCAAVEGRIVQIAFLNGKRAEIDLMRIMQKRLVLTGSTLRAREIAYKAEIVREFERLVLPLVADGKVMPVIEKTYPLEEAAEAHRHLEEDHIGKIVLTTKHYGSP